MTGSSRLLVSCCALVIAACGAGDNRIDPEDLELRDVLGISPDAARSWDGDQRAAARRVIEAGLHAAPAAPSRAAIGADPELDRRVAGALAAVDADRARHHAGALGLVRLVVGPADVLATARAATIEPHAAPRAEPTIELRLAGWDAEPSLRPLPARGLDVLAGLARDAGHATGPIVVTPAARLAVAAGFLPATATDPARLVVNPVVLAALEPVAPEADDAAAAAATHTASAATATAARSQGLASPSPPSGAVTATAARSQGLASPSPPSGAVTATAARSQATAARSQGLAPPSPPSGAVTANAEGNPYSFYGSVAECAAAQHARCDACLAHGSCTAITDQNSGNAECTQLEASGGRGEFLICINLALAIDAVATCAESRAPSCARDTHASESISSLEANARFLDDTACGAPLDGCLATLYGAPKGGFPGPGSNAGSGSSRPRNPSIDCSNWSGDSNCDSSPSCELDGPSCDDSTATDDGCSDSNQQSSCDSGGDGGDGGGGGGGDCSSGSGSSCDSGGDGGGDCSSDSGGDCGGGGGGDCGGGGGGDCGGGGGGDCNAAGRHGRSAGGAVSIAVVWALLPVPFAMRVRRRAVRRRAREAYDAQGPEVPS